jgi:hypothetical protein
MSARQDEFKRGLYLEHLEEISALYDLRRARREAPDANWRELRNFEERLEAHLDGLVVGGAPALELCRVRMVECDAGELFATVCVLCRAERSDLFAELWRTLDPNVPERAQAVSDALRLELPVAWTHACEQIVERGATPLFAIVAAAAAYRKLPLGPRVAARVRSTPASATPAVIRALSLYDDPAVFDALSSTAEHPDVAVRKEVVLGLLRKGTSNLMQPLHLPAQTDDWPHLALGLGGGRQAASLLRERVEAGKATADTLLALALLGDLTTVRAIHSCLTDEDLSHTAAWALHTITGASLQQAVFVPEAVDEAELFPVELERWRASGEPPLRSDGQPFGSRVEKMSVDPTAWSNWLTANARQFDPNVRYRRGRPHSARAVFDMLVDPQTPDRLRRLVADELVIRFRCPLLLDTELPVLGQYAELRAIAQWFQAQEAQLPSGGW